MALATAAPAWERPASRAARFAVVTSPSLQATIQIGLAALGGGARGEFRRPKTIGVAAGHGPGTYQSVIALALWASAAAIMD